MDPDPNPGCPNAFFYLDSPMGCLPMRVRYSRPGGQLRGTIPWATGPIQAPVNSTCQYQDSESLTFLMTIPAPDSLVKTTDPEMDLDQRYQVKILFQMLRRSTAHI